MVSSHVSQNNVQDGHRTVLSDLSTFFGDLPRSSVTVSKTIVKVTLERRTIDITKSVEMTNIVANPNPNLRNISG